MTLRKERHIFVRMDDEHRRLAKTIASLHGMSMKDYIGKIVEQDAINLPEHLLAQGIKKKEVGGRRFESIFK